MSVRVKRLIKQFFLFACLEKTEKDREHLTWFKVTCLLDNAFKFPLSRLLRFGIGPLWLKGTGTQRQRKG